MPILYWFAPKWWVLFSIGFWLAVLTVAEIYRFKKGIPTLFGVDVEKIAGPLMRGREERGVGGHIFFMVGAFIAVLLYSKNIAIATTLIMVFADTAAAIVGKSLGRHQLVDEKTLEGTSSFIFVAFIVSFWLVGWMEALVAAVVAGVVELLSIGNDNLTIPIFSGLSMSIVRYFLLRW